MKTPQNRIQGWLIAFCLLAFLPAQAATITWINPAGGSWSVATNWSPAQVPGTKDTATINVDGNYSVALDTSASVANLVLGAPANVNTQTFLMNGQTLTLNGQITVGTSGVFTFNGGILAGTTVLVGAMTWTSGNLGAYGALTIATNGILTINGNNTLYQYGALTNAGTVNWIGGDLEVYNDNGGSGYIGGINNLANALFSIQSNQTIACACYGYEYFNNAGMVRKGQTTGTTAINVIFNNSGTVEVQSGTISLNGGGTGSSQFLAEAGGTLAIDSAYTATANSVFAGAGTNLWIGGILTMNGTVATTNTLLAGAALTGGGTLGGLVTWTGGTFGPYGTLTVATNGVLTINGNSTLYQYGAITNAGTVNWIGGDLEILNDNGGSGYIGGINNLANALFSIQSNQTIACACYGYEYFNNAGMVRKSGAVNATVIGVPFNNSGTVEVQSGTISLNDGGTGSGQFLAEASGTLAIDSAYTATASSVFAGAGTNLWIGGSLTMNGTVATTNTLLAGAVLTGGGTLAGSVTWSSGSFGAYGTLTVATNGVLTIDGNSTLYQYGAITNAGTVNWTGGIIEILNDNGGGGYIGGINNLANALFSIQSNQTIACACYGYEYFNNAGMVRKTGAANTTVIGVPFNNSGTIEVQNGIISLNDGGTGSGQFLAEVGGTLAIGSAYTATASSVFAGAGTNLWVGGSLTMNGTVATTNTLLAGAALTGGGTLGGLVTWTGGTFGPYGTLTIATNGVLTIDGNSTLYQYGAITNAGTVNWIGGDFQIINENGGGYIGGINNLANALFSIQCDQTLSCACYGYEYFNNAGMVRKGTTTGNTAINVVFYNAGTVDVESGTISLNSSHSLSGGTVNFGITGATNFGSLYLAGSAALDGALTVHVNPGYVPGVSNSFPLVTYASETGTFTNVTLPADLNWQTNYTPTAFTVTAGYPQSALGWLNLGYTTNGTYTIDPSGSGPFSVQAIMTLAGGGWTELTTAVANSLLNTNIGTPREYLYVQTATSYYYRTPSCGLVWNWGSGQDLDGTYYYSTGGGESSFQITASGEHQAYGVGGSSGPGGTHKCLVYASSCLNPSTAQVQLCQDSPGIFGGSCQCGVTVYIRENGAVNSPAKPIIINEPTNQLVMAGGTAQFGVNVTGAVPLSYQWSFAQTNVLAGATSATLSLNNVSNLQAGYYTVVITNVYGSATSTPALLQVTPALTWANPSAITYGAGLSTTQLDASSGLPGSFIYSPSAGTVLNAGTNTLSVTFNPSNSVYYASSSTNVTVVVNRASLTVTASNTARLYGQSNPTFTGTITGIVNGDNITANYASIATSSSLAGTYPIVPNLVDPYSRLANYNVTTNNGTLTVNQTTLAVTWPTPGSIYYGMTLGGEQLDASANIPGTFVYTPAAGTNFNVGSHALTAVFTPTDTAYYPSATNQVNLTVNPAPLSVTASNVSRPYKQANPVLTGTITGVTNGDNLTATFATAATTNSPAGNYPIVATLVDPGNRLFNYTTTTNNGTLTVSQLLPAITWASPSNVIYGAALSTNQLDASASVPGSLSYTPVAGTVLDAGTNLLTVMFTPTDSTNYSSATDMVSLVVSPAPLSITAYNVTRTYGQANPALTGTIMGVVNGDNLMVTGVCSAVSFSPPGTYPIVPGILDPNNRSGNYNVTSSNGTLTVTSSGVLPTLLAVTPNQGLTNGGTTVTLLGSGFELGATVFFNGQAATSTMVESGSQIAAITPSGPLGAVNVTAHNPDGNSVTLTNGFTYIGPPPSILTQPANLLVALGSNAVFTVSATNYTGFQWLFKGVNLTDNGRITGSHTATLTVPGAQSTDVGNYQVIVNNAWGSTPSSVATLSVIVPPGIVTPPANQTVGIGGVAVFNVAVSGTAPFTYQWLLGGLPISGATNSVYSISSVSSGNQGQQYSVMVSNPSGTATSTAGGLTVLNYCASAQPGQAVYPMGSTVPITLQTFNCSSQAAVPNSSAIVWISTGGTTRSLPATTGPSGTTTVNFVPLPTESGVYQVAAALPGQGIPAAQGTFTLVGMSLNPSTVNAALTPNIPVTNSISLNNLTGVALSGITATVGGAPADVQVTILHAPGSLAGNAAGTLTFSMVAPGNYVAQDRFYLQLTTAQGTTNYVAVTATITPIYPQLVATPASLIGTMVGGGQTLVSFYVANNGGITSGPVQVLLPSVPWLSVVTPVPLPPLAPGQSNLVTLALTPVANLALGAYPGTLELTTANADLSVPFVFDCVSALTGILQVTVQDELSVYGTNSPNVSNAVVQVKDFLTGAPVTNVVTDATGVVTFTNLISAYYTVAVSAPDHGSFSTTLLVAANQTNDLTAFLNLQLVDYTWVVTPTVIPDHYIFTLDTTFQTQVPWPVVTVSPAIDLCTLTGVTNVVNLMITNNGLISAQNANLYFGPHPDWIIQPLVSNLGDLAPESSIEVPVTIIRIGSTTGVPDTVGAQLGFSVTTPTQFYSDIVPIYVYDANPADCEPAAPTPPPVVTVCPTCGGGGGGGGGYGAAPPPTGSSSIGSGSPVTVNSPAIQSPNYTFQTPSGAIVQVKLEIKQSAVIARDAFNASLQLVNGTGSTISNLTASITVYDASNNVASGLFGIPSPALSGLNAVNGTGVLGNGATGSAAWTIVPATNAAPTTPTQFSVGGFFSYVLNGEPVTVPLYPVPITVLPTPILNVDYFLQHDVYSDDPFTLPIEPSIPFPLGIRVHNIGYGDAYDFSITSGQPKIIQNSNDLLIAFELIGSEVGTNQSISPSFTLDLGNIGPGGSADGLWFMTSTLEGQFIAFSATYQHVDDFGNTNTSLINNLNIHEMNHVVELTVPTDDGLPDFLVNDTTNVDAPPGIVYSSDGTTSPVTSILTNTFTTGVPTGVNTNITVTVPASSGWAYYEIIDPGDNNYPIASVTRSDGGKLLVGPNVWQTPERDHMVPAKPNNLIHIFDYNSTGSYTVTYGLPVLAPTVTTLNALNITPTNATLNAEITPNGADTDAYFQWGSTTNYGSATATASLTESLNLAQALAQVIGGLQPYNTYHFRAVAANSAGTTFGSDLTLVTPQLPPPEISPVSNRVSSVGQTVVISNHVVVATAPAHYSLDPSDPEGVNISTNGVFNWTPTCLQGSSTNLITIWVTDSSAPPQSNSITFMVVVGQCVELELGSTVMQVGTTSGVPVTLLSTIGLTNLTWYLSNTNGRFTNWVFASSNSAIANATSSQSFFSVSTTGGQALASPSLLGTIRFLALPGPSAFLSIVATNISGTEANGSVAGNITSGAGRVVVVAAAQPLLEPTLGTNATRTLILYDNPGGNYHLMFSTNLTSTNWQSNASGTVTNLIQYFPVTPAAPSIFYRAQ